MLLRQNNKGQITKELSVLITKKLQQTAKSVEYDIKPMIREELEKEHINNVYSTFGPITESGRQIQKYNKEHKHQKKQSYHHTGTLLRNIRGVIDGNVVKIIIKNEAYPDDKPDEYNRTAPQVYDWLKYGTPSTAKNERYRFKNDNGELPLSTYVATPRHRFEEMTLVHMEKYLKDLENDIKNHPEKYISTNLK